MSYKKELRYVFFVLLILTVLFSMSVLIIIMHFPKENKYEYKYFEIDKPFTYEVCAIEDVEKIVDNTYVEIPENVNVVLESAFINRHIQKLNLNNVKIVFPNAFNGAMIYDLDLSNVEEIYSFAFFWNNLEKLEIPETVKYIDSCAFYSNRDLKEVYFYGNPKIEGSIFDSYNLTIYGKKDSTAEKYAIEYGYNFIEIE